MAEVRFPARRRRRPGSPTASGAALVGVALVLAPGPALADTASGPPCAPTDPFCAAGALAGQAAATVWTSAMTALWNAGLWLLGLAFRLVDALTTPDLSQSGPLGRVYPVTFGLGAAVAVLMSMLQLGRAALRRDGRTLGRLFVGLAQYGLVWAGYVGVAAVLVTGTSGLTHALLGSLLHVDAFAGYHPATSVDTVAIGGTEATVLGVCSVLLLVPASVGYLLLMLVREASLLVLAATSPIAASGLLSESTGVWFWKSLRWFIASLLIAPVAVLVLGVGIGISAGVVTGDGSGDPASSIGAAVVGCLLVLVGAVCPLLLFRLLAFVEPGTPSGAAMRQSLAAHGGLLGLASRATGGGGAGLTDAAGGASAAVAAAVTSAGRARGEATAELTTGSRFAAALGGVAEVGTRVGRVAAGVAGVAADVLSGAGVGHPTGPSAGSAGPPPVRIGRPARTQNADRDPGLSESESWRAQPSRHQPEVPRSLPLPEQEHPGGPAAEGTP